LAGADVCYWWRLSFRFWGGWGRRQRTIARIRLAMAAASALPLQLRAYETMSQTKQQASFLVQMALILCGIFKPSTT
jgi:hypothetical protein